jgi:phosphoribosylanthranilate isomerase
VTLVKVCGICDAEAARAATLAGADVLGFHFCDSRRRVTPELARSVVETLPRRPQIVGVFIDAPEAEVAEVAEWVGLDAVQLHGTEAAGFRAPRPLIKALKVRDGRVAAAELAAWPDPVLLDSWSDDKRGGTGRTWDWDAVWPALAGRQVIVAGGLSPRNVGTVVRQLRPHGVDVSSGVESEVRVKDATLLRAFVQAVRDADATADD